MQYEIICVFLFPEQFRKLCPDGFGYVITNGVIEGNLYFVMLVLIVLNFIFKFLEILMLTAFKSFLFVSYTL